MPLALQVNMNGMRLPEPDAKGRRILRVPLERFPFRGWSALAPEPEL